VNEKEKQTIVGMLSNWESRESSLCSFVENNFSIDMCDEL